MESADAALRGRFVCTGLTYCVGDEAYHSGCAVERPCYTHPEITAGSVAQSLRSVDHCNPRGDSVLWESLWEDLARCPPDKALREILAERGGFEPPIGD
ncbi:hypothetical protein BCEP4_1080021 [Burkholderia cepacia]|nr:hypothetical protein BCEP4_1080021 [Burkholderia cepacia]